MYCPTACADFTLLGLPTGGCPDNSPRVRTPSRLAFMPCSIELPSVYTDAAVVGELFDTGGIVVSPPIKMVISDPEQQEISINPCTPPYQLTTRRMLSIEDRTKWEVIDDPATTPANEANKFYDYAWWKDKLNRRSFLRYGIVYCNGDFKFLRTDDGQLMQAQLNLFIAFEELQNNSGMIEFKKGSIAFSGDPLKLEGPDFNLVTLGIEV